MCGLHHGHRLCGVAAPLVQLRAREGDAHRVCTVPLGPFECLCSSLQPAGERKCLVAPQLRGCRLGVHGCRMVQQVACVRYGMGIGPERGGERRTDPRCHRSRAECGADPPQPAPAGLGVGGRPARALPQVQHALGPQQVGSEPGECLGEAARPERCVLGIESERVGHPSPHLAERAAVDSECARCRHEVPAAVALPRGLPRDAAHEPCIPRLQGAQQPWQAVRRVLPRPRELVRVHPALYAPGRAQACVVRSPFHEAEPARVALASRHGLQVAVVHEAVECQFLPRLLQQLIASGGCEAPAQCEGSHRVGQQPHLELLQQLEGRAVRRRRHTVGKQRNREIRARVPPAVIRRECVVVAGWGRGYARSPFLPVSMSTTCVVGILWGDEGKGKVIDFLAREADFVVRFGGGHNAGHTLILPTGKMVLHLIPSGIVHPGVVNVIGNGVVVDPLHLVQEVRRIRERGLAVDLGRNLLVSERAQVILEAHRIQDQWHEQRRGSGKIGTTGRGIGPAYSDRAARIGLRMGDLLRPELLRASLERFCAEKNGWFLAAGLAALEPEALLPALLAAGEELRPAVVDTGSVLRAAKREGRRILLEGAQGILLDVDHGTYPFVTSSSASTGGAFSGTGLPPHSMRVMAVAKAYATRVGEGPFPTELKDDTGDRIRKAGNEYGSTTGRPRRCGWFDAVAVRYSGAVAGVDELTLTNLDVLAGFHPLRIATAYRLPDGSTTRDFPAYGLHEVVPVFEELQGFDGNLQDTRRFEDLPVAAREYVLAVERHTGLPVRTVSVGPKREQVILR